MKQPELKLRAEPIKEIKISFMGSELKMNKIPSTVNT